MEARVDGQWTGVDALDVDAAVGRGLDGLDGFEVRAGTAATCRDAACRTAVASTLNATHILEVSVDIVDRDVDLRLEVFEGRGGRLVASTESTCEVCADNEVAEMLTSTAARLRPRIEGLVEESSTLVIDGSPRTAELMLDGRDVGHAPFRGPVAPGPHRVVITAEGFRSFETQAYTEPGQVETLDFNLERREEARRRARLGAMGIGGAVSIALGIGATAAGASLMAVHGRPVTSSCPNGGQTDDNGRCPRMFDTRSGGIAAIAVGSAAVAGGIALLVLDRLRARRAPTAVARHWSGLTVRF